MSTFTFDTLHFADNTLNGGLLLVVEYFQCGFSTFIEYFFHRWRKAHGEGSLRVLIDD